MQKRKHPLHVALSATMALPTSLAFAQSSSSTSITYHTVELEGVKVFYREAGPQDSPVVLMLHGFPSCSAMFQTLIPLLANRYHIIAPDCPGFGLSDARDPSHYAYTFDHLAGTIELLVEHLGLKSYTLFLQDYGGPVGFHLAVSHPERVDSLVVQNDVASEDGLGPAWDERKAFWRDHATHGSKVIPNFLSLETTRKRHVGSSPNPDRYDPNTWMEEYAHLSRPGQYKIQSDLFYDYRTNVASYPAWQAWMRAHQPPTLVVWGRYDPSFAAAGATAYQRDLPNAEIHLLDAGHFALYEKVDEIAELVRDFLTRNEAGSSKPATPVDSHR